MIKIYCDTADIKTIQKCIGKYRVDGITTNPSIMRANGVKNYLNHCNKIVKIAKQKPLSVEVFADDKDEILYQANKISRIGKNIFVKIPILNTKNKYLTNIIRILNTQKVKINITAVFTFSQVLKIKQVIDKKTPVIISLFCGRIADNGLDPESLVKKTCAIFKSYKNVKILWASTREVFNFYQSKRSGCHIITMGPNFIEKLKSKKISLNEYTRKTVIQFYEDGKRSKFKI